MLGYAELKQIKELLNIVVESKVAKIIENNINKLKEKKRQNYRLSILNLIGLYFEAKGLLKYSY